MNTRTQEILSRQWTEAPPTAPLTAVPSQAMTAQADSVPISPDIDDAAHYHLARIVGRAMQTMNVKEYCGRLALVEFVPAAVRSVWQPDIDPVLVLPLFRVDDEFDKAARNLSRIQMDWVAAGMQPDSSAMTRAMRALDTMSASLADRLQPDEARFWSHHMRRIVSQPSQYLPTVTSPAEWPEWAYVLVFLAVLAGTFGSLMLIW